MLSPLMTLSQIGRIFDLEDALKSMPQHEMEVHHHFAPGVYMREMRAPAGVCATGAIHKTEHLSIILRGRLKVVSTTSEPKIMESGDIWVSPPGSKRAAIFLEDTVWLTIHPTTETDVDKLGQELVHNDRGLLEQEAREMLEDGE